MLKGLRTALYHVNDISAAKRWYSEVLEKEPYFDEPFYVGFNVGGGIKVVSVIDPFGNVLGIIENPLFRIEVE